MSVNLLYCEGISKGPDIRVLRAVLRGTNCAIKPFGGKYGFGDRIRIARGLNGVSVIAGLLDRDFDPDDSPPLQSLRPWRVENNALWLGWRWERKEIENYLLDPHVVSSVLGNRISSGEYENALQTAAAALTGYTAARTALSVMCPRFSPLANDWGTERGKARHKYPPDLGEPACREGIHQIIGQHNETQLLSEEAAFLKFDEYLPLCRPGGIRYTHFLTFFAGKDVFCALDTAIRAWGFDGYSVFKEAILKGIEESQSDVWNWLPEWGNLRQQVLNPPV